MLKTIESPADLRRLSLKETEALAAEIRQTLVDAVAATGGHLASNLGAVELTLALHRVFDMPFDKVVFDVGHQSYTHKLLTGRQARFATLRAEGGLSGFPKRSESPCDVFETGHASTAISAALGLARARDLKGQTHAVAALVGDGAMTGGLCYEALNDAGSRPTQLIVLLNDNAMSIARNVGALSRHLTRLRGSRRWLGAKRTVKRGLLRMPVLGRPIMAAMERIKRTIKLLLVPGEFFEALGFSYLGPIDGHDLETLERSLRDARTMACPVVVHAITQKGRGYALAERKPEAFHGVAPFFAENGKSRAKRREGTVSAASVVEEALVGIAEKDKRVVAITAAMPQGTGLSRFAERFPGRFFDVGIAEEHAMTMAAGLAAGGLRPVFAVYATFLQRAMDQLLHDVCLQRLPVVVLVDHAGFVAGDGATHQGVYDLPMLRALPDLTVYAPCDAADLAAMLDKALQSEGPVVIRYPKDLPEALPGEAAGAWRCVQAGEDAAIVGYGHTVETARDAAAMLHARGISCAVLSASKLLPLGDEELSPLLSYRALAVLEEGVQNGGLCEAIAARLLALPGAPKVLPMGVSGRAPGAHSVEGLSRECGIHAGRVAAVLEEALHGQ